MAFVHGEGGVRAGTENTGGEILGQSCNEGLVGGCQFDKAGEVCGDGVERGNVGEAKLAESILEDRDEGLRGGGRVGGRVDGLDNLVYLRGDERV